MADEPKTTSLAELKSKTAAPEASMPVVRTGFDNLQGFSLMQRIANALAQSSLVPEQYQGNIANCLVGLEMAQRIGASPLMVFQNLYVVHGRPGWSAKFLIAAFNQCGRFSALRYEWQGKKGQDDWGCRAWAIEKSNNERIDGPTITVELAKKSGWWSKKNKNGQEISKWQDFPELMLMYRAAAWLVNTHAPEISMGLNTAEEIGDTIDMPPTEYRVTQADLDKADTPTAPAPATEPEAPKEEAKTGQQTPVTIDDALRVLRAGEFDIAADMARGLSEKDRALVESEIKAARSKS